MTGKELGLGFFESGDDDNRVASGDSDGGNGATAAMATASATEGLLGRIGLMKRRDCFGADWEYNSGTIGSGSELKPLPIVILLAAVLTSNRCQ